MDELAQVSSCHPFETDWSARGLTASAADRLKEADELEADRRVSDDDECETHRRQPGLGRARVLRAKRFDSRAAEESEGGDAIAAEVSGGRVLSSTSVRRGISLPRRIGPAASIRKTAVRSGRAQQARGHVDGTIIASSSAGTRRARRAVDVGRDPAEARKVSSTSRPT